MSVDKKFKPLAIGREGFRMMIQSGCYYVDKTSYLQKVFQDDLSSVLLFTRPRRFGKTLLLNMFDQFLGISADGDPEIEFKRKLFDGLDVLDDQKFVDAYMGQFPVLFLSLKEIKGKNFHAAYDAMASMIASKALQFKYLWDSPNLSELEKRTLYRMCDRVYLADEDHAGEVKDALKNLCTYLFKHFKRKVVLLIDEYDVPLAKASAGGYHADMVDLISGFFDVLKTPLTGGSEGDRGEEMLQKVVMTGCLKVAKNSIFTGVNNLHVNTVLSHDDDFSSIIGFNKSETLKLLDDYEMTEYGDMVKNNYDGYRFGKDEIFCPWDVINFVDENSSHKRHGDLRLITARNYWNGSTSDSSLKGYLGYLSENDNQRMQDLVDGTPIEITVNDSMNYDDLRMHRSEDFWSLLLHTGYLTAMENPGDNRYLVRVPNLEILECFRNNIKAAFDDLLLKDDGDMAADLAIALLKGDASTADDLLFDMLQHYVSVRDTATRAAPENFYHGMLLGILGTVCNKTINGLKSNCEAGNGYADITFTDLRKRTGVVLELKVSKSGNLSDTAMAALTQIQDRDYAAPFIKSKDISNVYGYAVVFDEKNCRIEMKKLK